MPSATVRPLRVAASDLAVLDNPLLESGYSGVYPRRRGAWCAKPFAGRHLGAAYRSPRDAAADVVRWWKAEWGDAWREAFLWRSHPFFRVKRVPAEPGWQSWRAGAPPQSQPAGYRLLTWVDGRPRAVPPPSPRCVLFADAGSARAYWPRWRYETFGLFAALHVRPWPDA